MNLFFIKEQGFRTFTKRMHPKEGILSKTSLEVSTWVGIAVESAININNFIHYDLEDTRPCELSLD